MSDDSDGSSPETNAPKRAVKKIRPIDSPADELATEIDRPTSVVTDQPRKRIKIKPSQEPQVLESDADVQTRKRIKIKPSQEPQVPESTIPEPSVDNTDENPEPIIAEPSAGQNDYLRKKVKITHKPVVSVKPLPRTVVGHVPRIAPTRLADEDDKTQLEVAFGLTQHSKNEYRGTVQTNYGVLPIKLFVKGVNTWELRCLPSSSILRVIKKGKHGACFHQVSHGEYYCHFYNSPVSARMLIKSLVQYVNDS